MRLVYPDFNFEMLLSTEKPTTIVIENQLLFSTFVSDLWNQTNGISGELILSEDENLLSFDKAATAIINPFSVNFSDKKITTAIHKELFNISNDFYLEEMSEINSQIVQLLDSLECKVDYPISFDIDMDFKDILKIYNVKANNDSEDFLDKIVSYIKLLRRICSIRLFIFVNLKAFFTEKQLEALYKECLYEEVFLINIESHDYGKQTQTENYAIIDKDLCTIEL